MAAPKEALDNGQRRVRIASEADISDIWAIDSSATKKFGSIPALANLAAAEGRRRSSKTGSSMVAYT